MSAIYWHENPAFDAPELNSPQPCIHGAGCVFTVKNAEGKTIPGCCRYVHPGEEGTGRRLFREKIITYDEGGDLGPRNRPKVSRWYKQPACVRLTGNAGFYERRRLKMPWQAWCALKGIPFTPNVAGVRHAPVKRIPFAAKPITVEELERSLQPLNVAAIADTWPALPNLHAAARQLTENAVKSINDPAKQTAIMASAAKYATEYMAAHPEQGWDKILATVKQAQDEGKLVDGWGGEDDGSHSPRLWRHCSSVVDDDDYYDEEDHKCTFCGAMASECGEDHGDDMRDWARAAMDRD
jgi:hypothetical protein